MFTCRDIEWVDWKGARYSLREEWKYVLGEASPKTGCTAGERDGSNNGMTPDMFQIRANMKILQRRLKNHGGSLPKDSAYLTHEEVLTSRPTTFQHLRSATPPALALPAFVQVIAVRLYSGPAYKLINEFLRQTSLLTGDYREQLAKHAGFTFAATAQHLCRAIRKLAAVILFPRDPHAKSPCVYENVHARVQVTLPFERRKPLYRSVRGELPRAFWVQDASGLVTAVETAFMSTSSNAATCISYMQPDGPNVLWKLHPKTETDSGFHRGADISMLSQVCAPDAHLTRTWHAHADTRMACASAPTPECRCSRSSQRRWKPFSLHAQC